MAKNQNVDSATFDGQAMSEAMDYRMLAQGETIEDVASIDTYITSNDLVRRRVFVEVRFKDWDNAKTMVTSKWAAEGTLTLVTHAMSTTTDKTLTIANARCVDVEPNAQKDDPGVHIARFVGRTTDGSTNPVT